MIPEDAAWLKKALAGLGALKRVWKCNPTKVVGLNNSIKVFFPPRNHLTLQAPYGLGGYLAVCLNNELNKKGWLG